MTIQELIDELTIMSARLGPKARVEISVDVSVGNPDSEERLFAEPIELMANLNELMILSLPITPKKKRKPK